MQFGPWRSVISDCGYRRIVQAVGQFLGAYESWIWYVVVVDLIYICGCFFAFINAHDPWWLTLFMRSGAAVDLISSRCLTCRLMTFVCTQLQTSTLKFRPLWERTLTFAIGKTVMVAVWLIRKASIVAVRWWLGRVELRWRVVWSFFDMCYTIQLKNIAGYRDWQTNSWSSSYCW